MGLLLPIMDMLSLALFCQIHYAFCAGGIFTDRYGDASTLFISKLYGHGCYLGRLDIKNLYAV